MRRPVNFDDQSPLQTNEIHDVTAERHLPAEFLAGAAAVAHDAPEHRLRIDVVGALLACKPQEAFVGRHGWRLAQSYPSSGPRQRRGPPSPARGEGALTPSPRCRKNLMFENLSPVARA